MFRLLLRPAWSAAASPGAVCVAGVRGWGEAGQGECWSFMASCRLAVLRVQGVDLGALIR